MKEFEVGVYDLYVAGGTVEAETAEEAEQIVLEALRDGDIERVYLENHSITVDEV